MDFVGSGNLKGRAFDHRVTPCAGEAAVVDLRGVNFVTMYGLVGLACVVEANANEQRRLIVHPSDRAGVNVYLTRMGLVKEMEVRYQVNGDLFAGGVQAHDHADTLVELTRISDFGDVARVGDLVFDRVHADAPPGVANSLFESVVEICENVFFHAESSGAWVAAQTYKAGTAAERIEVAIGDVGRGVKESMSRHNPTSDAEAVRLAIQYQVSGLEDVGRGVGIADTIGHVTGLGGTMIVRSGSAHLSVNRSRRVKVTETPYLPGTIVAMQIPCGS